MFGNLIEHAKDSCLIASYWRPPNNSDYAGILMYNVSINGSTPARVETVNINGAEGERIANISSSRNCHNSSFSVVAINNCGMGPMSSEISLPFNIRCENLMTCDFGPNLMSNNIVMTTRKSHANLIVSVLL